MKLKDAYSLEGKLWQPRQHIEKQRRYFANKGPSHQGYGFSSSHVCMWELDYKESWALKNWCFWSVVLEKTLESPLDCKDIQPVHPKGDQSWMFIGGTNAEAETSILWPSDAKSWLIWKDPDAETSNKSILKEISPECSLEGLMLKLKLQYFGHLMQRADSFEKTWCWEGLGAGGEGDERGWDGRMASPTRWTWVWVNSRSCWWTERPAMLQFMGSQRIGHDWTTELNWTELNILKKL